MSCFSLDNFIKFLESAQKDLGLSIKPQSNSLKKDRNDIASIFIALLWEDLSTWINNHADVFGLSQIQEDELIPMDQAVLFNEMGILFKRSNDFPPAKLRSYATKLSEHFTKNFIIKMKESPNSEMSRYERLLREDSLYWFRRSSLEHLQTGMHTAISANFKMIAAGAFSAQKSNLTLDEALKLIDKALDAAHYLSTCHMTILHATDGALWDSAGFKEPSFWSEKEGALYLSNKEDEGAKVALEKTEEKFFSEERTGCPALNAKTPRTSRVTREVREWCLNLAKKFYLPFIWCVPPAEAP